MQRADIENTLTDIVLSSHDWRQAAISLLDYIQKLLPQPSRLSLAGSETSGDFFKFCHAAGHHSDKMNGRTVPVSQFRQFLEQAPAGERGTYRWQQKPDWITDSNVPGWFGLWNNLPHPRESVLCTFYSSTELTGFILIENFSTNTLTKNDRKLIAGLINTLKLTVPKFNPLINDPEKLQQILISADKMASLGQLISGVAHELNNPVSFIESNVGFLDKYIRDILQVIQMYESSPDIPEPVLQQADEFKERIEYDFALRDLDNIIKSFHDGAYRIKCIIGSLSSFSRADKRMKEEMNIHDAIDNTINLLIHKAKHDILFKKQYDAKPYLVANRSEVNQALMNILVNAVHAIQRKMNSSQKGCIQIRTRSDSQSVFVSVQDNGEGIPESHLDKIFQPFFTTKPYGEGTGLGLSITREIVQRHQGDIQVQSRPGEGSTFILSFPLNLDTDP